MNTEDSLNNKENQKENEFVSNKDIRIITANTLIFIINGDWNRKVFKQ